MDITMNKPMLACLLACLLAYPMPGWAMTIERNNEPQGIETPSTEPNVSKNEINTVFIGKYMGVGLSGVGPLYFSGLNFKVCKKIMSYNDFSPQVMLVPIGQKKDAKDIEEQRANLPKLEDDSYYLVFGFLKPFKNWKVNKMSVYEIDRHFFKIQPRALNLDMRRDCHDKLQGKIHPPTDSNNNQKSIHERTFIGKFTKQARVSIPRPGDNFVKLYSEFDHCKTLISDRALSDKIKIYDLPSEEFSSLKKDGLYLITVFAGDPDKTSVFSASEDQYSILELSNISNKLDHEEVCHD